MHAINTHSMLQLFQRFDYTIMETRHFAVNNLHEIELYTLYNERIGYVFSNTGFIMFYFNLSQ
jgi:hypothetical protein